MKKWESEPKGEGTYGLEERHLHQPAMVKEVIQYLGCRERPGCVVADLTVGTGGHVLALLEAFPDVRVIGFDKDMESLAVAGQRLEPFAERVRLVHGDYRDVQRLLRQVGYDEVDACLIDAGLSSFQLMSGRGFSFQRDDPLDMRFDRSAQIPTARDLVNTLSAGELTELFLKGGVGRRAARAVAQAIVTSRQRKPIETTAQLAQLIAAKVKQHPMQQRLHPSTKHFMALRLAVNDEADALEQGLKAAINALRIGGRIVTLTYQSIEDRIVKVTFKQLSQPPCDGAFLPSLASPEGGGGSVSSVKVRVLTKKPVYPSPEEIHRNPRARSCRLRAAERIE